MTRHTISVLLPSALAACTLGSTDMGKGSSTDNRSPVELTLLFDGVTVATGSCGDFQEITTSERLAASSEDDEAACAAGVELHMDSCGGVHLISPVFSSLEVGVASEMLEPIWVEFSVSGPQAISAESTDQWRGTMEIVEWGEDRRVIDLVDGVRRIYGEESTSTPTTGTVILEGSAGSAARPASENLDACWRDVDADELLCSSDMP